MVSSVGAALSVMFFVYADLIILNQHFKLALSSRYLNSLNTREEAG